MEKEKANKLRIQLFAEESETTDYEEDNLEEELSEKVEETEEVEPTEEVVEEPQEETIPMTQKQLDEMIANRVKRERKKIEREYESKLSKYDEMAYYAKQGTNTENDDDALNSMRNFYHEKGIEYTKPRSADDEAILANVKAQKIINDCEDIADIESEVKKLLNKGTKLTNEETLIAQNLTNELNNRKKISELAKLGVKEDVYNSNEFKEFESRFKEDTPIDVIYDMYRASQTTKKVVENPGSMKSTAVREKKNFITEQEYDKMTREEIKANLDLIEKSMPKW